MTKKAEPTVECLKGRRSRPVGNKADAIAAAEGRLRWVGGGAYKEVYISPDGRTVYKIDRLIGGGEEEYDESGREAQEAEFHRTNELRMQGHKWPAPTSLWIVNGIPIIAQPAYEIADNLIRSPKVEDNEKYYRLQRQAYELEGRGLIGDMHSGNYGQTRNGQLRIVDGYW